MSVRDHLEASGSFAIRRVLSGPRYAFDSPAGLAVAGARLWVTSPPRNKVTALRRAAGTAAAARSPGAARRS